MVSPPPRSWLPAATYSATRPNPTRSASVSPGLPSRCSAIPASYTASGPTAEPQTSRRQSIRRSVRASTPSAELDSPPPLASPLGLELAGVHSVHRFRRHCRSLLLAGRDAYPARWCDPSAVEGCATLL